MPQKDFGPALSRVRLRDLLDFFWRPAGDEHMVSFRRETPAERSAEAALGTDTDNDRARRAHDFAWMRKVQSAHLIGRLRSACATPPSTNNSVPVT